MTVLKACTEPRSICNHEGSTPGTGGVGGAPAVAEPHRVARFLRPEAACAGKGRRGSSISASILRATGGCGFVQRQIYSGRRERDLRRGTHCRSIGRIVYRHGVCAGVGRTDSRDRISNGIRELRTAGENDGASTCGSKLPLVGVRSPRSSVPDRQASGRNRMADRGPRCCLREKMHPGNNSSTTDRQPVAACRPCR